MYRKLAIAIFVLSLVAFAVPANAQGSNIPEPVVEACQDQNPDVIATFEGVSYTCGEAQGVNSSVTLSTPIPAPMAVQNAEGEVIIPPVTAELTAPFAFVQQDTPVYTDPGLTRLAGTAVKHQSFPVVQNAQAPAGMVAIRLANTSDVYYVTAQAVQVAERDYLQDWALQTEEVFYKGLVNGCPDLREARDIVAIQAADGSDGRFALERISTEYCAYRFSGASQVTAVAPLGTAIQFLNFAGLGDGQRVSTFAMTVRFLIALPPTDVVNAAICDFVQRAIFDALDRPVSERFDVQPYGVQCTLDRTVPEQVSALSIVANNAIVVDETSGCPTLPAGSAENRTAMVAFERVQRDGWFFCLHTYDESAELGNISFVVPEGVIIDADDGRYCAGETVVSGGATWYWDEGACTPSHGG